MVETEISVLELIKHASLVVQIVMALLVVASVSSWCLIFQRAFYLSQVRRKAISFEDDFWSGVDLNELYDRSVEASNGKPPMGLEFIFRNGLKEFKRLREESNTTRDGVMEGVQRAMRIAISREQDELEKHLPYLASVASVSPYIGLLGTVWGIMNSFHGLANVQQATLAIVAPGISEALIATAMGLFAAIPAVLAFNRYSATVDTLVNAYGTFAEEFSNVLLRSLSR